jgi:hypothetical protein
MRDKLRSNVSPIALAGLAIALFAVPTSAQKTDVLLLSNGDSVTGEIKSFERGKLKYSTDAMGTVSVEWPKIINLTTAKTFRVTLEDGTILFGSMQPADAPGRVSIIVDRETIEVPTQSVVKMKRIKSNFGGTWTGASTWGSISTRRTGRRTLASTPRLFTESACAPSSSVGVLPSTVGTTPTTSLSSRHDSRT